MSRSKAIEVVGCRVPVAVGFGSTDCLRASYSKEAMGPMLSVVLASRLSRS